ncbi:MAG: hypothetical protein KAY24_17835 [Candidatus Eisenbacteria sp.]|nr:hypothetical protein [Candidatus Eisenbacteria bacterium]
MRPREEDSAVVPDIEYPYCPISRQLCRAGKVWSDPATKDNETFCAFWHRKELRCIFRMAEFDLFNVARSLDELRNR